MSATVTITESAAKRVRFLVENEKNPDLMLRLSVSGGGCSGFQYGFDLDGTVNDDDQVFEQNGIKVVIDEASLDLIDGSSIDYTEDLMAAAFVVKNPNATATCGCGSSFAL